MRKFFSFFFILLGTLLSLLGFYYYYKGVDATIDRIETINDKLAFEKIIFLTNNLSSIITWGILILILGSILTIKGEEN